MAILYEGFFLMCLDPDSNWGPFPLQGNALPTELSKLLLFLNCCCRGLLHLRVSTKLIECLL